MAGLDLGLYGSRRFMVEGKLGEGGMGTVYEAVDLERHARVALKMLRHLNPDTLLRFKGEFRKLQDLHHPNLVSLGELFEEAGRWFFTMELVRGTHFLQYVRPLSQLAEVEPTRPHSSPTPSTPSDLVTMRHPPVPLEGEPARLAEAPGSSEVETGREAPATLWRRAGKEPAPYDEGRLRHALAQLARGLNALHRAGKVHRDIKPSNILVTSEGRLVLLDFGILSDSDTEEGAEPASILGTAAYMAPEQTRCAPPSPEADWYSVGVLIYEALTGQRPFTGLPREVIESKRQREPPPPQALASGLPEQLCQLCVELLRLDPARRPAGEEVLQRLGVEPSEWGEAWSTVTLPFVGRSAELAALQAALADSRAGASVVVRVEGESGAGKSRLVRHFLKQVSQAHADAVILSGRCYERESVPYKGVDGLIEGLARYLKGPGQGTLRAVLPPQAPTLACLFPALQRVEGFAAWIGGAAAVDPLQLRLTAFEALRELLSHLAARHPLLLVIDDLQWIDRDGIALLEKVLRVPGLLLVATVRQSTASHSTAEVLDSVLWSEARLLHLEGLPPEDARLLALHLLQQKSRLPESEAYRIAQESGGYPLFIDALVRNPRASKAEGQPLHLEEALWARAQRLEPQAQGLLALLAVATSPLHHAVASHAVAVAGSEYDRLVASLRAAHLAITSGPAVSGMLEVLHDRVRQAVLPRLTQLECEGWHARLAMALEQLGKGEAEGLAHHWHGAGHPLRAVPYYLQAAREAAQALAFSREASLYQRALGLGSWSAAERRELQVAQGEALAHAGRGGAAAKAFLAAAEGAAASEALSLQRRAAEQYLLCGHIEEGLATMQEVMDAVGVRYPKTPRGARMALRWERLKLQLRGFRLVVRNACELPPAVLERLETMGSLAAGLSMVNPLKAASVHARYLQLALSAGEPRHLLRAIGFELSYLGWLGPRYRSRIQRWEQVLESLSPLLERDAATLGFTAAMRAWGLASLGEYAAARPHFERAMELLQSCQGTHWEQSITWGIGGGILSMMGELGEMRRRYERPLAEAWERKDLYGLAALELGSATLRWLGADAPQQGREAADAVFALWSKQSYNMQSFGYLLSLLYVELYQGESARVLQRLAEAWPQLEQAFVLKASATCSRVLDLRGRACLMEAARGGPGAEALLQQAEADARVLAELGLSSARGMAELAQAGIAAARGLPEAASRYGRAIGLLEPAGLLLHAMAARMRQGELLAGAEGTQLVTSALEWMRQRGIVRPERLGAMYAPVARAAWFSRQ